MSRGARADCVKTLLGDPQTLEMACSPEEEGGLSESSGFYAWWLKRGSLPAVPHKPHPAAGGLGLLYVGIAPVNATSSQTLRSRVLKNHLGGNTGSSTFRLSLASLLMDDLAFTPARTTTKVALPVEQNRALSDWQKRSLLLTWCEQTDPWLIEAEVIAEMAPPLNLAGNSAHPFHEPMCEARKRFKAATT